MRKILIVGIDQGAGQSLSAAVLAAIGMNEILIVDNIPKLKQPELSADVLAQINDFIAKPPAEPKADNEPFYAPVLKRRRKR